MPPVDGASGRARSRMDSGHRFVSCKLNSLGNGEACPGAHLPLIGRAMDKLTEQCVKAWGREGAGMTGEGQGYSILRLPTLYARQVSARTWQGVGDEGQGRLGGDEQTKRSMQRAGECAAHVGKIGNGLLRGRGEGAKRMWCARLVGTGYITWWSLGGSQGPVSSAGAGTEYPTGKLSPKPPSTFPLHDTLSRTLARDPRCKGLDSQRAHCNSVCIGSGFPPALTKSASISDSEPPPLRPGAASIAAWLLSPILHFPLSTPA
ncbi:hypothetical protein BDZ91DRAFT_766840 [Kalaharituber pfeilii]|nr:hypothetical protein BDZ91DRAFT_766840 [Kalaharituber pfeilii]